MLINWMALFGISLHAALLQGYDVIVNVYPNNPPKSPARSSGAGAAGGVGAAVVRLVLLLVRLVLLLVLPIMQAGPEGLLGQSGHLHLTLHHRNGSNPHDADAELKENVKCF